MINFQVSPSFPYYFRTGPHRRVPPPSPRVATTRAAARPTKALTLGRLAGVERLGGAGGAPLQLDGRTPRGSETKMTTAGEKHRKHRLAHYMPFLVLFLFFSGLLFFCFFVLFSIFNFYYFFIFSFFGTTWLASLGAALGLNGEN